MPFESTIIIALFDILNFSIYSISCFLVVHPILVEVRFNGFEF